LHIRRTLPQILNGNPETPGDGLLSNGPESVRFVGDANSFKMIEGNVRDGDHVICAIPGELVDVFRYFLKRGDGFHA